MSANLQHPQQDTVYPVTTPATPEKTHQSWVCWVCWQLQICIICRPMFVMSPSSSMDSATPTQGAVVGAVPTSGRTFPGRCYQVEGLYKGSFELVEGTSTIQHCSNISFVYPCLGVLTPSDLTKAYSIWFARMHATAAICSILLFS